jgi:hypothetical protein
MTAASSLPLHPHRAGIGEPLRRLEDARLLTARGCCSDDFNLAGQVYAVVLRSPHAHARIIAIETEHAQAMRGVLAVLTGAGYVADGHGPMTYSPAARHPPDIRLENLNRVPASAGGQFRLFAVGAFFHSQHPVPVSRILDNVAGINSARVSSPYGRRSKPTSFSPVNDYLLY